MPRPPVLPLFARPLSALCLVAPALAACSGSGEKFAPPCPQAGIVRDAADLTRYAGNGRDLTDLVLEGRITGLNGKCSRGDKGVTVVAVSVGLELARGPAAPGRRTELSYFVAVAEGDRILDKRVFPLVAEFPANTDKVRLGGDDVEMALPTTADKPAAAYRVLVGFQLSPAELEQNRRRPPR